MCDPCGALRRKLGITCLLVALSGACGGREVAPQREWHATPERVEPESVEWLYATDGFGGSRKAECAHVLEWVEGEAQCSGSLCRHGAKLGFDWMRTCEKVLPGEADRARALTAALEKRSVAGGGHCEDEAERFVREGCGERDECVAAVEKWGTQCGDAASPLVRRMLELAVKRTGAGGFRLDARSCAQLESELRDAARCEPGFPCEDAAPAATLHAERCDVAHAPASASTVILRLSVEVGAGKAPGAAVIAPGEEPIDLSDGWVHLADGTGVVLLACGRRVRTVAEYLNARAACAPDGEVVVARARRTKTGREIRVGRVPLDDDRSFWRRYPSLAVRGEVEARDEKWLEAFQEALDRAAAARQGPEATARLLEALVAHQHRLARSTAFAAALGSRDAALTPALQALGAAKRAAAKPTLRGAELVPFVARAASLPLADVGDDGRVALGATTPAAAVDLAKLTPGAFAAYEAELAKAVRAAAKKRVSPEDLEHHAVVAGEASARCGAATIQAEASELSLLDCHLGVETCTAEKLERELAELDRSLRDTAESHVALTVAIASLDPASREAARGVLSDARCEPPGR